jgi:superfamily II DNA or RNA helicase/HKD family nuclease
VPLRRGLYDRVITEALARELAGENVDDVERRDLSPDDVPERLVEVLALQLARVLADVRDGAIERGAAQLALINDLLREARNRQAESRQSFDAIVAPPQALLAIRNPGEPRSGFPETGLTTPWLFTAGRGSPSLLNELRREAAACDQIDILVSFITVAGVRRLLDVLQSVTAADASGAGRTRVRVLTTTYTGATEVQALDALAGLNGAQVKVSLDGRRTRLHAKAWIFRRETGFGSAYVGSANLSGAALMGGLEWTVKFTERGQEALYARARAHFDTLWEDDEFKTYFPNDPDSRSALVAALRRESGTADDSPLAFFDIEPKHYQREMLEQLARERDHGRHRNLIVAATGTGKTVVAALDYRNICAAMGHRPRLLFVAHRSQILDQALRTYREVLRDASFGDVLTGRSQPRSYDHVFASIDTMSVRDLVERLGAEFWHTVIIDECHRMAAPRFHELVTTLRPQELVGLTATPERTDGQSILKYFSQRPDGSPAVELRLWDALEMQLLSAFEYYGCDDETDFSDVPWDAGGEIAAINTLVKNNEVRARLVVNEWRRLSADPRRSQALVFCVSVEHARFITKYLNMAGLPALTVVGETSDEERRRALSQLSNGNVCALVTVDLYNEGVDLPDVDTLLLLRPTQSPVLFQQQIGRGLRLAPGKDSCLILDFVGQYRAEFRFDRLLGGITGLSRRQMIDAVETGFDQLPPGCHIQLAPRTRSQVLRNLKALTQQTWKRLALEAQTYATARGTRRFPLGEFLHDQRIALDEVYRDGKPSGWTSLRRVAGLLDGEGSPGESDLSRRLGWLLHQDDAALLAVARQVAENPARYRTATGQDLRRALMLAHQVEVRRSYSEFLTELESYPHVAGELAELAPLLSARSRLVERSVPELADVPLQLHGSYAIRESSRPSAITHPSPGRRFKRVFWR